MSEKLDLKPEILEFLEHYEASGLDFTYALEAAGFTQEDRQGIELAYRPQILKVEERILDRLQSRMMQYALGTMDAIERESFRPADVKWILERKRPDWASKKTASRETRFAPVTREDQVAAKRFAKDQIQRVRDNGPRD